MKYLLPILLLTGCCTVVPMKFPVVPDLMLEPCPKLEQAVKSDKPSDALITIVNNYTKYHECSNQNDTWIYWYNQQKEIHNGKTLP